MMGMFRKSCWTNPRAPEAVAPNPSVFRIDSAVEVNGHVVAVIVYPNCTNFEGKKCLLFKYYTLKELYKRDVLDPHFDSSDTSPFARFKPTRMGVIAAIKLAKVL
jgi:hypothetical protein